MPEDKKGISRRVIVMFFLSPSKRPIIKNKEDIDNKIMDLDISIGVIFTK